MYYIKLYCSYWSGDKGDKAGWSAAVDLCFIDSYDILGNGLPINSTDSRNIFVFSFSTLYLFRFDKISLIYSLCNISTSFNFYRKTENSVHYIHEKKTPQIHPALLLTLGLKLYLIFVHISEVYFI